MIASNRFLLPALLPCLIWLPAIFSFTRAPSPAAADFRLPLPFRVCPTNLNIPKLFSVFEVRQWAEGRFLDGSMGQATLPAYEG